MDLKNKFRHVLDFPRKGIDFIDITTALKDAESFRYIIDSFAYELKDDDFDMIVCSESRGFILGAPLAYKTNTGFVPIRKNGKLPAETIRESYNLEYGTDVLEIHADAIMRGQKIILIDDILATGGTIKANINLVEKLGGIVQKILFLAELTDLNAVKNLEKYKVFSLVKI